MSGSAATSQARWRAPAYPVPATLALIGGVLLGFGTLWGAAALVAALLLAWKSGKVWVLAACLLLAALGVVRERQWWSAPDPLATWVGAQVTLQGEWDGQLLHLSDPPAAVALSPKPPGPAGQLTIRGRLVRPDGRRLPGGFDAAFWLRIQGAREVLVAAEVRRLVPEAGVRGWFRRGLSVNLSPEQSALLRAVELGERNDLSQERFADGLNVRDAFARAGLAHLMALSGQNVALLVGALTWLLARLLPLRLAPLRYPVLLGALAGFLWLVGPSPSLTRAVLMGGLVLLSLWLGRGKLDVYGVLGLAAIASLLYQPGWLFDVGFQLSFLAVLGLSVSARVAALLPERWPLWLRLTLVATPCAELATLPTLLHTFGQLPLLSLPANLAAAGIMALLVPLGYLAGLLGPLAVTVNWLLGPLAGALLWLVKVFGHAPTLSWSVVSPAGFAAYGVFALAAVLTLYRRLPLWVLPLTALLGGLGTALPAVIKPPSEIVYLDVGQGDSSLIRTGGLTMLIDGGGTPRGDYDVGARTVLPALRAMNVRKIDVMVATHADADHIEGLTSVLLGLPVGELWIGERKDDPNLNMLLRAAQARGVPVREVRRGDAVRSGEATFTVLWPVGAPFSKADNDNSVVIKLDTPRFHTVFLGDLPNPLEAELGVGHLDLLKTAHHGSRFSSGEAFLNQTRPRDAVISVGRNTYGHPNPQVLDRLAALGVRVWRTDQVGTLRWPLP
ncbi:DNA internalization-related competence protein ComEC/Rec2 [Deinococcus irradiatisoli]|uniref:DNA internalization-related competence protein ComEC/Rec2 n=1 Tax=Deinococcus irradiatisoli TaxID=2202254 RepID=A0A2Z3JGK7_9DEIO|nr:DNA internalization-related competence protein ComEC/Rec2 [Deinococcus irradiatisoli]AWN22069.1 DNA internalization-related competence protein ComEC/Rec2 [Deinococcus irradiatisoli]